MLGEGCNRKETQRIGEFHVALHMKKDYKLKSDVRIGTLLTTYLGIILFLMFLSVCH
jgi:hypothetical protein